jgi:two-component sensor histidine kinase
LYAVARDITPDRELLDTLQRERKSLSDSLREREILLQEVHHRVKNNLQVISSLINLQARQLSDPRARGALEECKTRVEAIALIHEKLYQSKDYARVPFSDYAKSLARGLFEASIPLPSSIALELDSDDFTLPVDRAIPCALVLNELLTNSLKHAFPGGRGGLLRVGLHERDGEVTLTVADDGVGMPVEIEPAESSSLGMQLVATLSRQLDGKLELQRIPGTTVRVTFPVQGEV